MKVFYNDFDTDAHVASIKLSDMFGKYEIY